MSISWHETRERLAADKRRLLALFDQDQMGRPWFLILNSSYLSVFLYRISHYFFQRGSKSLARIFWHLDLVVTGADISPISSIGGGLFIQFPMGVIIVGNMGKNCTIHGHGGIGGGRDIKDIGAGPGLPVVGDNVVFGFRSMALGPVKVGNNVRIGPGSFITRDIPDEATVEMKPPRKQTLAEVD